MVEQSLELQSYLPGWQSYGINQQSIQELASYSLETKRIPDPYPFLITDRGELYSSTAQCLVKSVVNQSTNLGQMEYQALLGVEDLIKIHQDGVIIWISPPGHNFYKDTKLIISEVIAQGSQRFLFNRAIILDLNEIQSVKLASRLGQFDSRQLSFESTDQVRTTPLLVSKPDTHWSYLLEALIPDHQWSMVRDERDKQQKELALRQAVVLLPQLLNGQITDLRQTNFLGDFSGSCPVIGSRQTAFSYLFNESYWRKGSCRGKENGGCDATDVEVGPCKLCRQCEQEYSSGQRR